MNYSPPTTGVPQTAWLVLSSLYQAVEKAPDLWQDEEATKLFEKLAPSFPLINCISSDDTLYIALRKRHVYNKVENFFARNPNGVVVNLGCGLDTLHLRFPSKRWFDVDLPDITDVKKTLFTTTDSYTLITSSALDFSWMDQIPQRGSDSLPDGGTAPLLYRKGGRLSLF